MLRNIIVILVISAGIIMVGIFRPEFFHIPSLVLTLGGAVIVTCFSYSRHQLRELMVSVRALFTENPYSLLDHLDQLTQLSRVYQVKGLKGLEYQENRLADSFLKQGVSMLVDLYTEEKILVRLERELARVMARHEISRQILQTLGKLLPAFGLMGTLIGMVLILRNVSGQEGYALTGSLSLAVLTTLYGAILANVIVAPLLGRLQVAATEREMKMRLTLEWVMMLVRGETTSMIVGKLSALVLPPDANGHQERGWLPMAFLPGR